MKLEIEPAGTRLGDHVAAPYPFIRSRGDAALVAVQEVRAAFQDASPVIWGDEASAAHLFDLFDEDPERSVKAILAGAQGRAALEMMDEHAERVRAQLAEWYGKRGKKPPVDEVEAPRGSWPTNMPTHQAPLSLFDLTTGKPKSEVLIGLIPTVRSWEAPAFHKFGSWNKCPAPEVHVAIGREWAERFGARLIVNTADAIEYEVESPVGSREEAMEVAALQFRYCNDIVLQGAETLENLAASLLGARYWFFWWD